MISVEPHVYPQIMPLTGEEVEAERLLQHWVTRLGLQDWTIKLFINVAPEEMDSPGCVGCTEFEESIKCAKVEIMDPQFYGTRLVPFRFETTLVHELLHLKLAFWCHEDDNKFEDRVMHQVIDDLARAFTWESINKEEVEAE